MERDALNPARLALPGDAPDRIDLWITSTHTARRLALKAGIGRIKPVFTAREVPLFIACNAATPPPVIKALTDAFEASKKHGVLERINANHLKCFER